MADQHLYVPDDLKRRIDAAPAHINWSSLFQALARGILAEECGHDRTRIVCADCGTALVDAPDEVTSRHVTGDVPGDVTPRCSSDVPGDVTRRPGSRPPQ